MKKGFTLIELIVVIAIIAVLAAIIAPNAFRAIRKGQVSAAVADFKSIKTAAMAYFADVGAFPPAEESFSEDDDGGGNAITNWDGPYLDPWPSKCPLGGDYTWTQSGDFYGDGSGGSDEAFVIMDDIDANEAVEVDEKIDDGDVNDGSVLYNAANSDLYLLIAE